MLPRYPYRGGFAHKTILKKTLIRAIKSVLFICFWATAFLFLTQDLQVFPSAFARLIGAVPSSIPNGFESIRHRVVDGVELEVWRLEATKTEVPRSNLRALILHGNGGSLANFRGMQTWMAKLGITNYSFDYRGTGASTGWPSEAGIFLDSRSVFDLILRREEVEAKDVILVGLSIGSGFAAGLAADVKPKALVLFAPYTSIPDIVSQRPLLKYLSPLLRYEVSTKDYLGQLDDTCIVVAHGGRDDIIPISHSESLAKVWNDSGFRWYTSYAKLGHNNLFHATSSDVAGALGQCLAH